MNRLVFALNGWPLKYHLIFRLILLILIVGTVLTSISFTMQYIEGKSSRSMMMNLISTNINDLLMDLLDEIEIDAEVYSNLIKKNHLKDAQSKAMARAFIQNNLKANKYMDGFSIIDHKTGFMVRTLKTYEGEILVAEVVPGENQVFNSKLYENRESPTPKVLNSDSNESDPRFYDFYLAFKDSKKPGWFNSRGYSIKALQAYLPILSYVVPLHDDSGEFIGMLTVDLGILQLQKYLMDLTKRKMDRDYSYGGIPFVVERRDDGEIVVIGHPDPVYFENPPDPGIVSSSNRFLILAKKHPDLRIRAFTKIIDSEYSENRDPFNQDSTGIKIVTADDGQNWVYSWTATYPGRKPDWIIGVCVNRKLAIAGLVWNFKITALSLILLMIVTSLFNIMIARRFSKPIEKMVGDVIEIGKGNIVFSPAHNFFVKEMIDLKDGIEKMKSGLLSFRKYIPYKVVNQVLASRKTAEPFAEKKELTIFFSDLENFTTISESMEPDKLVKLIGEHLAMCTNIIQGLEGTVDKYIGDSVMAFWNAPEDCEGHSVKACKAGLRCQEEMLRFNERNRMEGLPELRMRIGISTGMALVGNIGSEDRLNYTAVGDTVNLASRLEGTNKTYKTLILISDRTNSEVQGQVLTRPVDKVAVKGKINATMIHEVLGLRENATPELLRVIELSELGFGHYLAQKFEQAIGCYQQILEIKKDDHISLFYIERCRSFLVFPPSSDWDGVHISNSK